MIPLHMYIYVSMSIEVALFGDHLIFHTHWQLCVVSIKLHNTNQYKISLDGGFNPLKKYARHVGSFPPIFGVTIPKNI